MDSRSCVHDWWAGGLVATALVVAFALSLALVPSASAAACPNEALRSENGSLTLADCRAYERVTPPAKNGAEFNSNITYLGDGPQLALESFATFGGSQFTNLLGASYEFGRSTTGWFTRPLGPSATQFEGIDLTTPLYALGTGERTLLGLRLRGDPVDAERFYLRQGSTLTEIGPEAPPASWIGKTNQESLSTNNNSSYFGFQLATPDVSHVVFELFSPGENDYLWPFDETGEGFLPSTYEYVGTGNTEPFLVGVTGGQGSTALVSGCGISVGSFASQDSQNAMSADGSTIFFTTWGEDLIGTCSSPVPPTATSELYARIDGEKPTAHTVAISEPTVADCSACQTVARQEAVFQGAADDGSRVFFLTQQELLPGNPGKNLYEYDFNGPAGEKVTAVSHLVSEAAAGVLGVVRVSEDGSHVYFAATAALTAEANSTGAVAQPGEPNLYVYEPGTEQTKFVTTLAPGDEERWSSTNRERQAEATPDGRFLLFASVGDLTPDDTSSVSQLFRYDASNGELIRVSVGQEGFGDNGNTSVDPVNISRRIDKYAFGQNSPPQKWMSDDGSYIFFESSKGLTPKALDHVELPNETGLFAQNVYQWHDGQVSLLSDGRDLTYIGKQIVAEQVSSVHLIGTDSSGENVLFTTASPLVPSDGDEGQDIYNARIGGGLPMPRPIVCGEENCQGPPAGVPTSPSPGSATFIGPENPKKQKKHKKKKGKTKHKKGKKHNANQKKGNNK